MSTAADSSGVTEIAAKVTATKSWALVPTSSEIHVVVSQPDFFLLLKGDPNPDLPTSAPVDPKLGTLKTLNPKPQTLKSMSPKPSMSYGLKFRV